ncbi:hypothetical protein A2U01_0032349 [Trifolium medium]|uniref:Uncharacterized protein n=1 Tax=Trifolium medium TaxID=97028 RepID=A0A392PFZ9_9FABA|nr:hypothetical protein [Trifolium medium]MCI10714.1 hypothetical protein [Trifolium medium]MCI11249.1 hypothetical protein [Trifolium medium]
MAGGATRSTNGKLDELALVLSQFQEQFNTRMDGGNHRVNSLELVPIQ